MRAKVQKIVDFLMTEGNDISRYNTFFIDESIRKRVDNLSINSINEYYDLLKSDTIEVKQLQDSLQINYSEFFRNSFTFASLEKIVLPSIIHKKKTAIHKEIRIWACACAGGQEAYSLAIQLEELLATNGFDIKYRIFATDQKQEVIDTAKIGIYPAQALKNVNLARLEKWFTKSDNMYIIDKRLKNQIDFSVFDLLDDQHSSPPASIFGEFDLVVCANLLFYYTPEYQNKIVQKVGNSLGSKGYLMTGETEREILQKNKFKEVIRQSAIYQK